MRIALLDPTNMAVPYVDYLASALVQNGHEVSLWASEFAYSDDRPVIDSKVEVKNHFYRLSRFISRPQTVRKVIKGVEHFFDSYRLARKLRKWKPDVIHYQQPPAPLIDSFTLQMLKSVAPTVITVHNPTPLHGEGGFVSRRYEQLLTQFDSAIVHTNSGKSRLINIIETDHITSVIRPGLYDHYKTMNSTSIEQPSRTDSQHNFSFLLFGGLKNYKGIDIALKAYADLPEQLKARSSITIAGSKQGGTDPARKAAENLGISSKITWDLRFIPDREIEGLFKKADAVLMPHLDIDLSGILMVTLALNRPFLASEVGCFSEYVGDGVHGLLSEPGNVQALSANMVKILTDPECVYDLTKNIESLNDSWVSWESVAKMHVEHYEKTLATN